MTQQFNFSPEEPELRGFSCIITNTKNGTLMFLRYSTSLVDKLLEFSKINLYYSVGKSTVIPHELPDVKLKVSKDPTHFSKIYYFDKIITPIRMLLIDPNKDHSWQIEVKTCSTRTEPQKDTAVIFNGTGFNASLLKFNFKLSDTVILNNCRELRIFSGKIVDTYHQWLDKGRRIGEGKVIRY